MNEKEIELIDYQEKDLINELKKNVILSIKITLVVCLIMFTFTLIWSIF